MGSDRYQIEFRPAALRDLEGLEKAVRVRIAKRVEQLASNPRPSGAKKLPGEPDLWRVRVGDYRVVYRIEDARLVVLVVRVGHRQSVYRRL